MLHVETDGGLEWNTCDFLISVWDRDLVPRPFLGEWKRFDKTCRIYWTRERKRVEYLNLSRVMVEV